MILQPETTLYDAWRRPKVQSRATWEKVPGLESAGKYAIFAALQREQWKAYGIEYEYMILPVGEMPRPDTNIGRRQAFSEKYRTKVMKPQ